MPADPDPTSDASALLGDLTPEEREAFARRHYVRKDPDLIWREPGGVVRRERLAGLYYVRTQGGVFRVSRLTGEIVEV